MINRESIDKLAQQIGDLFGHSSVPQDMQRNLRALIQSGFDKMDLVTRDEFDAQTAVLERTRATLERVEKQLDQLEAQLSQRETLHTPTPTRPLNDPPQ